MGNTLSTLRPKPLVINFIESDIGVLLNQALVPFCPLSASRRLCYKCISGIHFFTGQDNFCLLPDGKLKNLKIGAESLYEKEILTPLLESQYFLYEACFRLQAWQYALCYDWGTEAFEYFDKACIDILKDLMTWRYTNMDLEKMELTEVGIDKKHASLARYFFNRIKDLIVNLENFINDNTYFHFDIVKHYHLIHDQDCYGLYYSVK